MKITRFRRTATGSPYEIVKPYGGQHIADKLRNIAFLFFCLKNLTISDAARQTQLKRSYKNTFWHPGWSCHSKVNFVMWRKYSSCTIVAPLPYDSFATIVIKATSVRIWRELSLAESVRHMCVPFFPMKYQSSHCLSYWYRFFWLSSPRYVCLSFPLGFIHFNL